MSRDVDDVRLAGAIFLLRDVRRGAMEVNVGRTGSALVVGDADPAVALARAEPLSASALRVLSTLLGWYLGNGWPECDPRRGLHPDRCPHRVGRMNIALRPLARRALGSDGGSQLRQVNRALDELAAVSSRFFMFDPLTRAYARGAHHVLSFAIVGRLPAHLRPESLRDDGFVEIAWDPFLLDSLLAGRYQSIPLALIQKLRGSSAFRIWLQVLLHPAAAGLVVGESREFAVTGDRPSIAIARMGLDGLNRPAKIRATLDRAAESGNAAQNEWRLAVVDRRRGGLKLRLTRRGNWRTVPPNADRAPAATQGRSRGMSRTLPRHVEDALPLTGSAT